jgi:membrane-bound lytic murein transglycosylase A
MKTRNLQKFLEVSNWVQGLDLNQRPSGYEPDELPGCSTLQYGRVNVLWSGVPVKSFPYLSRMRFSAIP